MSDLSIHLTTARRFILGGRACGMAWLDNYQERDYQSTQYFYDGDGQRVKKVGYQNVAAGRVPTSNGTLRWPYVVTNGDTWADSGMGESGEFAYTDETGLRYVQIDLGGVYTVDTIKVWHWANDGRTDHQTKTEVSADGVTWTASFDADTAWQHQPHPGSRGRPLRSAVKASKTKAKLAKQLKTQLA
jgi:hypothetical protein